MRRESVKVGRRGTVVLPASVRRRLGFEEGTLVLVEERPDSVVLRPAAAVPVRVYSREEKASFLLENAVGPKDYERAARAVRKMGLDPESVRHRRP